MREEFKIGECIKIAPKWQDKGDEELVWVITASDEGKGRLTIAPLGADFEDWKIHPTQVVSIDMVERIQEADYPN